MELVEPAKGRGLVQLAGSQRVWEDEFAAGRDRNKTRDESGSELGAKSGLESSVGPRTASSVFGEQRFPIMSAASVQLHVETAKPIRMASASPSEEIPYKQAEASSATLFGTPEFEERARMTSRPFGIEDEANGEGNTPTEDVADLSISVEAGQDEATNNENPQPEEATTDSIHCAKPVPAVPSRRGSAFLTSDSIDAPLEDSHDQETFELSDYDAVKTCASVFPEASPPAVPAPAITLALSESFLSSSEGRQRDTSPIDSATKQIPDATKKVQERKRNLSNVKIPMEPNSNPTAPASSNFFLVAPTPIKWTAEERIAIHRALTLTPLLPDLPARAHLPAPREALLAQIAPLLYNTLSNKSLPFESPASRKAVCWGALRARAASGTTCPVWMLSNRDYGSLIGRGDVALRRPLSRGALEGVVEAVSGGASGSSNMQSFEPNLLSKDGGKFLRSFHARNWLLTSWFGDAHAVWNMDEEKPFNRAPSVLLAGQVLPPTGVVDVSRDDQLVAVTYSNGSTYVWNIENSRLGESKLQPVSVLLHPEHTSNVYTQNRRVSALSFNASTGSYPFICAAYQDRVVFVDSRTKKHVHTQIMQPGACVTAAHWSEVHAHSVATGGADGLIRVWDLRRAGGPLHAFDDSKVEVAKLEWAPGCGGVLMAARKDGRITLYNAHRGYKFFTHEFHADLPLISAFWNEDPDYEGIVLSAANVDDGEDSVGTVQVWRSNAYIRERLALAS
ncbi:WD40-repeat-containing domain protein [Chytriomyces sp. MP71]|nr:WD40-repeat-containing domain protein [Chytriomyces sp. MP71]